MPSESAAPGMSSTPSMSPINQACLSGRAGANPTPQLPNTTVVTPCQHDGVSSGSQVIWPSKCVWMSTNPGVTISPSASIVRVALVPASDPASPTSVTTPSSTATSARRGRAPVPSTSVPPVMTRLVMGSPVRWLRSADSTRI